MPTFGQTGPLGRFGDQPLAIPRAAGFSPETATLLGAALSSSVPLLGLESLPDPELANMIAAGDTFGDITAPVTEIPLGSALGSVALTAGSIGTKALAKTFATETRKAFNPLGLNIAAATLMGIGGVISAASQVTSANVSHDITKMHQQAENQRAEDVERIGAKQAMKAERYGRDLLGAQSLSFAAQNIDVEAGTAEAVRSDTIRVIEEESRTIRNNAMLQGWGIRQNAKAARIESRQRKRSAGVSAGVSLLGTAANIAGIFI